jgi:hypothetical protein
VFLSRWGCRSAGWAVIIFAAGRRKEMTTTSGEDRDEETLDATVPEEIGGPFIETSDDRLDRQRDRKRS